MLMKKVVVVEMVVVVIMVVVLKVCGFKNNNNSKQLHNTGHMPDTVLSTSHSSINTHKACSRDETNNNSHVTDEET